MILTKLELNFRNSKVINLLTNANNMHKFVMSMFPDVEEVEARKSLGVLYELITTTKSVFLLIQSNIEPDIQDIPEEVILDKKNISMDLLLNRINNDNKIRVEILSEPYKKVQNINSKNSRRKVLTKESEKLEWFHRHITNNGCSVLNEKVDKTSQIIIGKKKNNKFQYRPSLYSSIIVVNDKDKFIDFLKNGLGSGKSYGMGMIKVFVN